MYRLTKVRLHNICQYSEYEALIDVGLTAITAPNGSGKTNFLRAVVYGLTGMVDGLWGGQKTLQKDGTSDVGRVAVSFTDGTDEYTVTRFSTSSVSFCDIVEKGGELVAKRRKAVDAFMEGVFGMSCRMMFTVCWGRQGELASLLCAPPAIVGEFLANLFDTSCMETLRAKLKAKLDEVATLDPACRDRLASYKSQLADLPSRQLLDDNVSELEGIKETRDALMKELDAAIASSGKYTTKVARANARVRVSSINTDISDTQAELDRLSDKACEYMEGAGDLAAVEDKLAAIDSKRDSAYKQLHDMLDELRGVRSTLERVQSELDNHRAGRDKLDAHLSADKCALCGTCLPDTKSDEYRRNLYDLLGVDMQWDEALATNAIAQQRMRMDELTELTNKKSEQVQKLDDVQRKLVAHRIWLTVEKLKKDIEELELERAQIIDDLAKGDGLIRDISGRIRSIDASISGGIGVDAALAAARAMRDKSDGIREMLAQAIAQCEKDVEQYERNNNVRETLSTLRDAFGARRAQAKYLESRVHALNRYIAMYMELTGMPFSLRLDTDSRMFVYVTSDGYEHPAVHLSGAQKSMSAVALQMAVFAVMSPSMNLYLIDEPTEALDASNKEIMASMFSRMSDMLPSVDGVMMIVTRDQEVVSSCRNVMDISG